MKTTIGLLIYSAVTIVVALVSFLTAAILVGRPSSQSLPVANACSRITVGMSFSQMNTAVHYRYSDWDERADFSKHEFLYSGTDGTCRVTTDADGASVLGAQFEKAGPSFDDRAF